MNLDGLKPKLSNLEYVPPRLDKFDYLKGSNDDLLDLKKSVSAIVVNTQSEKDLKNNIISFNSLSVEGDEKVNNKKRVSVTFISDSDPKLTLNKAFNMNNENKKSNNNDYNSSSNIESDCTDTKRLRNSIAYSNFNAKKSNTNTFRAGNTDNSTIIGIDNINSKLNSTTNKGKEITLNNNDYTTKVTNTDTHSYSSFSYRPYQIDNNYHNTNYDNNLLTKSYSDTKPNHSNYINSNNTRNNTDCDESKKPKKRNLRPCIRSKYIVNNFNNSNNENQRKDIHGVVIDQLKKSHKVSFADQKNEVLVIIKRVKSYMNINRLNSYEPSTASYQPACLEFCVLF